jgi:hypothetical protein
MSPDNVLLHFLLNFPHIVYIDICDWAMAGGFNELKELLYIHENEEAKFRTMRNRWWVAPGLSYIRPRPKITRDV